MIKFFFQELSKSANEIRCGYRRLFLVKRSQRVPMLPLKKEKHPEKIKNEVDN
jgi:hypothetical protein